MKPINLLTMIIAIIIISTACNNIPATTEASITQPPPEPTTEITTPEPDLGYTIKLIANCSATTSTDNALTLFDNETNLLSGWSHIADGISEFEGLNLPATAYKISATNKQPDPTCNDNNTVQVILVKKIADWDRQHANGVEPQFAYEKITFSQIDQIVIDLKLNSDQSTIPTEAEIAQLFGDYLTEDALDELDNGQANFSITLFEKGYNVQSSPSFTGDIIVGIDPAKYNDQWIRIAIPAENLTYFEETNYERTDANFDDFAGNEVIGLRINPETASGKVVRNYIPDTFDDSVPKLFKEMAISIARVEIHLKEQE